MSRIRRILVAIKDPAARKPSPAVLKAAQLARACGAQLHLCHCLTEPVYLDGLGYTSGFKTLQEDLQRRAKAALERAAERLTEHSIKVTVSAEWDYPAHEAIIRQATRIKADLIVIDRHAGKHGAGWLLRLTDWELLRWSPIPVLLVRNPHAYRRPAILAAVDPTHAFAKPLQLDQQILGAASSLRLALHGSLHAVHAYIRAPIEALPQANVSERTLRDIEKRSERAAVALLDRALRHHKVARAHRYAIGRHPIDAITEAAEQSRSAIVVMGAISRTGFRRLLIGNTAERILDSLKCDVLVVKPAGFRNRVPAATRGVRVALPADTMGYF
ncbi:MAG: universal stress protein [Steroidobacteraceae bacterium]